jgi:hypothetical protein
MSVCTIVDLRIQMGFIIPVTLIDQHESQFCYLTDRNLNLAIAPLQHYSILPFRHLYL